MNELNQWLKEHYQIEFENHAYLLEAMTHSSYCNEHRDLSVYNERIEFLGDSVLGLFVSRLLYVSYPDFSEGQLSKLRAQIVCEESLMELAKECKLDQYVRLGKGEERSGGRMRPALLCDLFEAFVGALYLDKGFEEAERFLSTVITPKLQNGKFALGIDYKTALQEELQKNGEIKIEYIVLDASGPSHQKIFTTAVVVEQVRLGTGMGKSKKIAEQEAAKQALQRLEEEPYRAIGKN